MGSLLKQFMAGVGGGNPWPSYWTQQYVDAYNAFVVKPTIIRRLEQARMVKTLVDSGVWDKLDVFQYYENGNLINWIAPGTYDATLHGNTLPAYVSNVGFQGNPTELAYIDTGYNPATVGNNYGQDSACYGTYVDASFNDGRWGSHAIHRCYTTVASSGGDAYVNINQSTTGGGVPNPNNTGGVVITNRSAADAYKMIVDGITVVSQTVASSGIANINMFLLAYNNNGTPANFDTRTVSCFFAGAGLSDDEIQYLTSAIKTCIFYANKSYGNHIPLMPSPVKWNQHGADALGDKIYIMGGSTDKLNYEYDPIKNRWEKKTDLPFADANRQSAGIRASDGKVYFIGGMMSGIAKYNDVYEYDPVGNTYTQKEDMPTVREDFGTAVLDGKIYCFGGISAERTKALEIYDIATNSWTTGADLPEYKQLGDFGCACNGKVYAIGASDQVYVGPGVQQVLPVKTCYSYDPATDEWTRIADIPVGTVYNERAVIGNYIYVVAGVPAGLSDELATYIKDIYRYDTINDVWTKMVDAPYALHGTALAEYDGNIFMVGGGRNSTRTSDTNEFYKLVI